MSGCAGRDPRTIDAASGRVVGIYRGRIEPAGEKARGFRLLLYAARPDRIHGELFGPMGGTQLVVDGGGGRLAVSFVRDRIAYVGAADAAGVGSALGVALELSELVGALLDGALDHPDYTLRRSSDPPGRLPEELELRSTDLTLRLKLRQRRLLGSEAPDLGTGRPSEGAEIRPIEELASGDTPAILEEGEPQ